METTIQQNNISTNVSINIAVLKEVIQSALQSTKQRVLAAIKQHFGIGAPLLPRLYRKQLRLVQALANGIEAHPVVTNATLLALGIAIVMEAFLFA